MKAKNPKITEMREFNLIKGMDRFFLQLGDMLYNIDTRITRPKLKAYLQGRGKGQDVEMIERAFEVVKSQIK